MDSLNSLKLVILLLTALSSSSLAVVSAVGAKSIRGAVSRAVLQASKVAEHQQTPSALFSSWGGSCMKKITPNGREIQIPDKGSATAWCIPNSADECPTGVTHVVDEDDALERCGKLCAEEGKDCEAFTLGGRGTVGGGLARGAKVLHCWNSAKAVSDSEGKVGPLRSDGTKTSDTCNVKVITKNQFDNILRIDESEPDALYSWESFHAAVNKWNEKKPLKKVFQGPAEVAAFFGNAIHESGGFQATREYACLYQENSKKCRWNPTNWNMKEHGQYCKTGEACDCTEEQLDDSNEIDADKVWIGRGALQLSWNKNYYDMMQVIADEGDNFCTNPDLIATKSKYLWGSAIWYWATNKLNEKDDFGQILNLINGKVDCNPCNANSHKSNVKLRLKRYCKAAKKMDLKKLMSVDRCAGMRDAFNEIEECGLESPNAPGKDDNSGTFWNPAAGERGYLENKWEGYYEVCGHFIKRNCTADTKNENPDFLVADAVNSHSKWLYADSANNFECENVQC